MLTTVIGAYPKPSYLKITDWFNASGGTDILMTNYVLVASPHRNVGCAKGQNRLLQARRHSSERAPATTQHQLQNMLELSIRLHKLD